MVLVAAAQPDPAGWLCEVTEGRPMTLAARDAGLWPLGSSSVVPPGICQSCWRDAPGARVEGVGHHQLRRLGVADAVTPHPARMLGGGRAALCIVSEGRMRALFSSTLPVMAQGKLVFS